MTAKLLKIAMCIAAPAFLIGIVGLFMGLVGNAEAMHLMIAIMWGGILVSYIPAFISIFISLWWLIK